MPRTSQPTMLISLAAATAAGVASAQTPITVINGFNLQTWNAGTSVPNVAVWTPEKPSTGWADGLRWNWYNLDVNDAVIPPEIEPVFDPAVPGIMGAYKFPEARAVNMDIGGTPRGAWETQAQPGEPATFEIWFKPSDLSGTHVLWEVGATNKGVAFAREDDELVYAVRMSDEGTANVADYQFRHTLTDTEWRQALIVIDLFSFEIRAYLDGVELDSQGVTPSATYRWAGGNPAGLGMIGSDPLFPDSGIAGDAVPTAAITTYDGWISTLRFYDVDLFANEVADNYDALTDAAAAERRADYNGDGLANTDDKFDFVAFMTSTDTAPIDPFNYPFPHDDQDGVQTNDPAMDETYLGDFAWDRDGGWNPTSQEPTFQFPAINILEPVPVNEPAFPSIRTAFEMNGDEGFRGPKFEFADDTTAIRVLFWLYVDDLVGNHCLFEAGGDAVGFSMVTRGSEIAGKINTSATDGLDIVEVTSGPGVLQTGWHRFEIVVRRFTADGVGQGYELYMDGQQIAAINDLPGLDGEFGTGDDINNFSPAGTGNSNFIGGNQAGLGQIFGTAPLPLGLTPGDLTPFNGMVGPFRMIQSQPLPAQIAADFAADATQNVINDRGDVNRDGSANFFDVLQQLQIIDAAQ